MSMPKPNYTYKDIIYIVLIVASAMSGTLIDKTTADGRLTAVEKLADKNADKLEKANLELILYRMDIMEEALKIMAANVTKLDIKIDDSTKDIITALNNRRR